MVVLTVFLGLSPFSSVQATIALKLYCQLESFVKATHQYGVPSRVRSDQGGENVGIWRFMEDARGSDRGSYITGSSVHNTRIERLWRDVYTSVSSTYVPVFSTLEERNMLNPENEPDLFCLHYVFIPMINKSLTCFQSAWNNHPLSTERNRSPMRLFTGSPMEDVLVDDPIDTSTYGVDPDQPQDDDIDTTVVIVPETFVPLSENSKQLWKLIHYSLLTITVYNSIVTLCL